MSAILSVTKGLTDNGAGYGGGMAPDTVLRYGSWSDVQRTITISGLNTAKKYDLEFYTSKKSAGYSTVFTINGKSDTVLSSYNLTNKASFAAVTPNASGQIVVTAFGLNTYNYINGFMFWESATGTSSTTQVAGRISALDVNAGSGSMNIYPNPVRDVIRLHLNNPYKGEVRISVYSTSGNLIRTWQMNKENNNVQYELSTGNLTSGAYILKVQMGNVIESRKLVK
jgi:hypothetical protein